MKMQVVLVFATLAVIFLKAWLISRACRPTLFSPMSPSISALGVSAATESITMMSMALERISWSAISRACSPLSGCDMSNSLTFTPNFSA